MAKHIHFTQNNLNIDKNYGPIFGGNSNFYGTPPASDSDDDSAEYIDVDEDEEPVQPQNLAPQTPVSNVAFPSVNTFAQKYVIDPAKASIIMQMLHLKIDSQTDPKSRLLPLRAAKEAGVIAASIPFKDVAAEFAGIASATTYSIWMNKAEYKQEEIEPLITLFANI